MSTRSDKEGQVLKKQLFGTSRYLLSFTPNEEKFSLSLGGIIQLYDARRMMKEFRTEGLQDTILTMQKIWEDTLGSIYDRRLVLWVSELFTALELDHTDDVMFKLLRDTADRKKQIEKFIESYEEMEENVVREIGKQSINNEDAGEDLKQLEIYGVRIQTRVLPVTPAYLNEAYEGLLLNRLEEIEITPQAILKYVDQDEKTVEKYEKFPILTGKKPSDRYVQTEFSHTGTITGKEAELIHVIPLTYDVADFECSHASEEPMVISSKEDKRIVWKLGDLQQEELIKVSYKLTKNQLRLIMYRLQEKQLCQIWQITPISEKRVSEEQLSLLFKNIEEKAITDLHILDCFPISYTIESTIPEQKETTESDHILQEKVKDLFRIKLWRFKSVSAEKAIEIKYQLGTLKFGSMITKTIHLPDDSIVKISKLSLGSDKKDTYKTIIRVNSAASETINDLSIRNSYPVNAKIEEIKTAGPKTEYLKEIEEDTLSLYWKIDEVIPHVTYKIAYSKCFEGSETQKSDFEVSIGVHKQSKVEKGEREIRSINAIMPRLIQQLS